MSSLEITMKNVSKEHLELGILYLQNTVKNTSQYINISDDKQQTIIDKAFDGARVEKCVNFLGEVSSKDFITYKELSERCFITEGILNPLDHGWLHFELDGKTLLVAKQHIRYGISWDYLNSKEVVFGDSKILQIKGSTYRCRLLKGADPTIDQVSISGFNTIESRNSEWSRLFYPIITNDPNIKSYMGPSSASYTEADLQMHNVNAHDTTGSYSWCQERHATTTTDRVIRGHYGPSHLTWDTSSTVGATYGWRPVLELIES